MREKLNPNLSGTRNGRGIFVEELKVIRKFVAIGSFIILKKYV